MELQVQASGEAAAAAAASAGLDAEQQAPLRNFPPDFNLRYMGGIPPCFQDVRKPTIIFPSMPHEVAWHKLQRVAWDDPWTMNRSAQHGC